MMRCDLETIYAELDLQLPERVDGNESITFSSANLPSPPVEIETGNLYILKSEHYYNDWFRTDALWFFADKKTYRRLGMLIFSVLFQPKISAVKIRLNHPESDIKSLIIESEFPNMNRLASGFHSQPFAFEYYPQLPGKHPYDRCISPADLACFELSNSTNLNFTDEDWKGRDAATIFGSDAGLASFAELLLNVSQPESEQDEFELEGESGFRGVGIRSAEVKMYLPGSYAWMEEHWQRNS